VADTLSLPKKRISKLSTLRARDKDVALYHPREVGPGSIHDEINQGLKLIMRVENL
jgi:hypothetical protein